MHITELSGKFAGQVLRVIGSGPSLARLTRQMIGPGPVVAVNHAIKKVETLALSNLIYSMQKDQVYEECAAPILAHAKESAKDSDFGDYIFDCEADFGIPWYMPSLVVCLHLARLFGCVEVEYLACDSFTGDYRSYDARNTPALDRRASQYMQHPAMVASEAARIEMPWTFANVWSLARENLDVCAVSASHA